MKTFQFLMSSPSPRLPSALKISRSCVRTGHSLSRKLFGGIMSIHKSSSISFSSHRTRKKALYIRNKSKTIFSSGLNWKTCFYRFMGNGGKCDPKVAENPKARKLVNGCNWQWQWQSQCYYHFHQHWWWWGWLLLVSVVAVAASVRGKKVAMEKI